jgi:hypothetical protein
MYLDYITKIKISESIITLIPILINLKKAKIYLRKFGNPEFDLTVELHEDSINGPLIDTLTFTPAEVPSTWTRLELNFTDVTVTSRVNYFIKCPPALSGITTSFCYERGYAFGNQYDDGAFWFTRDGGNLWRDLPTMMSLCLKPMDTVCLEWLFARW